jgi:hypothetical protein
MSRNDAMWSIIPLAAILVCGGCKQPENNRVLVTAGDGPKVQNAAELGGDQLPYTKGNLILGGTSVLVSLERKVDGPNIVFNLLAHGEQVEQEFYEQTDSTFGFRGGNSETYEPPISLCRFPMNIGDKWKWGGKITTAGTSKEATAEIISSQDKLNLPGGPFDTYKIEVLLKIEAGGPKPAERKLAFWFQPKKGIIKRELGALSTRQPASGAPEPIRP